jgi:hypothetical protein
MMSKRGNPNWGKPDPFECSKTPSAFEHVVNALHLQPGQYVGSKELRNWVQRNMQSHFVPEDLLNAWHLELPTEIFSR